MPDEPVDPVDPVDPVAPVDIVSDYRFHNIHEVPEPLIGIFEPADTIEKIVVPSCFAFPTKDGGNIVVVVAFPDIILYVIVHCCCPVNVPLMKTDGSPERVRFDISAPVKFSIYVLPDHFLLEESVLYAISELFGILPLAIYGS